MIETTLFIAFINLLSGHVLECVLLVIVGISLLLKRPLAAIVITVSIFLIFSLKMYGFRMETLALTNPTALKVVSMSVRSSNPNLEDLLEKITSSDYDVISLQEVEDKEILEKVLSKKSQYKLYYDKKKSTVIISRFVAVKSEHVGNIQKVTLALPEGKQLTVYNIHAPKFIKNINYYNSFFEQLISDISLHSSGPTMVMGDFNSTKDNYWRGVISKKYKFKSTLHDTGEGWLATFPSKYRVYGAFFSFVSIDDIYVRDIEILKSMVVQEHYGSDHYPVYAILSPS